MYVCMSFKTNRGSSSAKSLRIRFLPAYHLHQITTPQKATEISSKWCIIRSKVTNLAAIFFWNNKLEVRCKDFYMCLTDFELYHLQHIAYIHPLFLLIYFIPAYFFFHQSLQLTKPYNLVIP